MKVQVISKEAIKPSSPTPSHLTDFKLSYIDQLSLTFFIPVILFYRTTKIIINGDNILRYCSNRLKESLSKCLTSFYPLAGRIVQGNNTYINCNDDGVHFLEAMAMNCNLSDITDNHSNLEYNSTTLNQFLPYSTGTKFTCNTPLLAIQVTAFDCGGIAIGICLSHKVADAFSVSIFLKAWSSSTTATNSISNPRFDFASMFPPVKDFAGFEGITDDEMKQTNMKIVTKRFVFDASSICSIRQKLLASTNNFNGSISLATTRFEAIAAFMIKCFHDSGLGNKGCDEKPVTALLSVNLRKRRVPPVPDDSFGNMYVTAFVPITSDVLKINANDDNNYIIIDTVSLVGKIKAAIANINGEYVKKVENKELHLNNADNFPESVIVISSWCRFGFYDFGDFGWGKPIWVSTATMPINKAVMLMDTRTGDGIEAWVNLFEEDMIKFEQNQELRPFASATSHHQTMNS